MVKCADCGFLTVRDLKTREWVGVDQKYRETGTGQRLPEHGIFAWEFEPMCLVMAADLRKEIKRGEAEPKAEQVKELLNRPRVCKEWYAWHQGFTPKEHAEQRGREQEKRSDRHWRLFELVVSSVLTLLSIGTGALIYWLSTLGNSSQ